MAQLYPRSVPEDHGIYMRSLFIIFCLLFSVGLQAQTIKGRVMEETEDGEVALPGANVYWGGYLERGSLRCKWRI